MLSAAGVMSARAESAGNCRLYNVMTLRDRCPVPARLVCRTAAADASSVHFAGRCGPAGWSKAQRYRLAAGSEEESGLTPSVRGVPQGDQTPLAESASHGSLSIWSAAA
jgi:hypothetical protein